jgi:hypothetical protein
MVLQPPSEVEEFSSRHELIAFLQAFALTEGYAITIRHSNAAAGNTYLGCDRGGTYRNQNGLHNENRQRNTGSRLTGCPFSIRASSKNGV